MSKKRKDYLEDYLDFKDFEYDYKSDPLYQAVKKQYLDEAERTAEDVLGKYSAISGGGSVSSAAVSAASNAANGYKSKLSEVLPTLYDMAWDMYKDELESKKSKYEAVLKEDKFNNTSYEYPEKEDYGAEPDDGAKDSGSYTDNTPQSMTGDKSGDSIIKPDIATGGMNDGMYEMTKNVIYSLVKSGDRERAGEMYRMYKNAMTPSQRREIEGLISG